MISQPITSANILTHTTVVVTFKHKVLCILRTSTPGPGQSTCKPQPVSLSGLPILKKLQDGKHYNSAGITFSRSAPRSYNENSAASDGKGTKKNKDSVATREKLWKDACASWSVWPTGATLPVLSQLSLGSDGNWHGQCLGAIADHRALTFRAAWSPMISRLSSQSKNNIHQLRISDWGHRLTNREHVEKKLWLNMRILTHSSFFPTDALKWNGIAANQASVIPNVPFLGCEVRGSHGSGALRKWRSKLMCRNAISNQFFYRDFNLKRREANWGKS